MAAYFSEDEFDGFLSDDYEDQEPGMPDYNGANSSPPIFELTEDQKLHNFYFAIITGGLTEVILAINEGTDVNVQLKDGWNPILLAASVGNSDIVLELINRGANINSDRDKHTPLMLVCSCLDSISPGERRLTIINALLERGANANAVTRKKRTALMFAAINGNTAILQRLLSACNINAEDNQGWTALFWAVNSNKPDAVGLLIEAGLDRNKVDIRGNSLMYYANDLEDIVKILGSHDEEEPNFDLQTDLYDVEELFMGKSPKFFRDTCAILYGMKCEYLANYFCTLDLLEFLSLDKEGLEKLGIKLPYQKNKILTGLHKFHGHVYKQKSIPVIPKDVAYSTIDVGNVLVATIRQIIAMEAGIAHIMPITSDQNTKLLALSLKTIRLRLTNMRKAAVALKKLTQKFDSQIQPVDLISKPPVCKKQWLKYVGCIGAVTLAILLVRKRI